MSAPDRCSGYSGGRGESCKSLYDNEIQDLRAHGHRQRNRAYDLCDIHESNTFPTTSTRNEPGKNFMSCSVHYDMLGTRVSVRAPDDELAAVVRRLFRPYETQQASDSDAVSISVERCPDEFLVRSSARNDSLHCPTLGALTDEIEFALTETFLMGAADRVQLHASGCVVDGQAVLAVGASGAGKSSLATCWSLDGLPALGDDVVLLDGEGHATPFKRQFTVDPDLLAGLGSDPATTPFWTPGAEEAWFDPEAAGGWADSSPVRVVAFIAFEEGKELSSTPVTPAAGLNTLLHGRLDSGASGTPAFECLANVTQGASFLNLRFGDAEAASRFLAARVT